METLTPLVNLLVLLSALSLAAERAANIVSFIEKNFATNRRTRSSARSRSLCWSSLFRLRLRSS